MTPPFQFVGTSALACAFIAPHLPAQDHALAAAARDDLLSSEKLTGDGQWVAPRLRRTLATRGKARATVWFDEQLLGDQGSYRRRRIELGDRGRRALRRAAVATLKHLSRQAHARSAPSLAKLVEQRRVRDIERHWIINGFSCTVIGKAGLDALLRVPGVKKVFLRPNSPTTSTGHLEPPEFRVDAGGESSDFDADRYRHPWYTEALLADRVWRELGITGEGTLNVIHDGNFVVEGNVAANVYANPDEIPGNGRDDDQNGLIDDYHGYNFIDDSPNITAVPGSSRLHGTNCALIICGTGTEKVPIELGIAPRAAWAGVVAGTRIEAAVEWAVARGADTYSMSFSIPGLGETRSHWRKVMEHGSLCGVYFVSGAGNFARKDSRSFAPVPVQMRTPEDIPDVVFAAAGVQRDLSRSTFSSQGPVEWQLEHYRDGRVQKPEVCAFNFQLPTIRPDGELIETGISGNSFAGPMFCGTIALMLSADPDLLPWDLREIITATALDVGPRGIDSQTGHGLINCYRAVRETLRRRALRENLDASRFTGRESNDTLDVDAYRDGLTARKPVIRRVTAQSAAERAGVRVGDVPIQIDGTAIHSEQELGEALDEADKNGRSTVSIILLRDGKMVRATVPPRGIGIAIGDAYVAPVLR